MKGKMAIMCSGFGESLNYIRMYVGVCSYVEVKPFSFEYDKGTRYYFLNAYDISSGGPLTIGKDFFEFDYNQIYTDINDAVRAMRHLAIALREKAQLSTATECECVLPGFQKLRFHHLRNVGGKD